MAMASGGGGGMLMIDDVSPPSPVIAAWSPHGHSPVSPNESLPFLIKRDNYASSHANGNGNGVSIPLTTLSQPVAQPTAVVDVATGVASTTSLPYHDAVRPSTAATSSRKPALARAPSSTARQPLPPSASIEDISQSQSHPIGSVPLTIRPAPSPSPPPHTSTNGTRASESMITVAASLATNGGRHSASSVPPMLSGGRASNYSAGLSSPTAIGNNGAISPAPHGRTFPLSSSSSVAPGPNSPLTMGHRSINGVKITVGSPQLGGKKDSPVDGANTTADGGNGTMDHRRSDDGLSQLVLQGSMAAWTPQSQNQSMEYVSAFILPPEWKFSVTSLVSWLLGLYIPSLAIVIAIYVLPVPHYRSGDYTESDHWLFNYVGYPIVAAFCEICLADRASILTGVNCHIRTIIKMWFVTYALVTISSAATASQGFVWWRTIIAYAISMTMSVVAPRIMEPAKFKDAIATAPELKKSSGRVALTMIGLMAVAISFQYVFPKLDQHDQEWLIISLNGFAFLFRLGLTISSRPQPIALRVLLSSFYSIYLFDVFVAAALPSSAEVTTLLVTAAVQLAVHIVQPFQLTYRFYMMKTKLENRFGVKGDLCYQAHLERYAAVYFFSLFAHWCVPFLFFVIMWVFQYGPMYRSLPLCDVEIDKVYNLIYFHGLQVINVTVQIALFSYFIHRYRKINMLSMAYFVIRSGSRLFMTFGLVGPLFAFSLVVKQDALLWSDKSANC